MSGLDLTITYLNLVTSRDCVLSNNRIHYLPKLLFCSMFGHILQQNNRIFLWTTLLFSTILCKESFLQCVEVFVDQTFCQQVYVHRSLRRSFCFSPSCSSVFLQKTGGLLPHLTNWDFKIITNNIMGDCS